MAQVQSLNESIRKLLDEAAKAGQPCPSIRAIRAKIGRGSFGTISEVVAQWKTEQLTQRADLPEGFAPEDAEKILGGIWKAVASVVGAQVEKIEKQAEERVQIEREEAVKVRQLADEVLTEYEAYKRLSTEQAEQIKTLTAELSKVQGALEQTTHAIENMKAERASLQQTLEAALQEATKAKTELASMQKLLPFLDPQHLDKLKMP